MPLLLPTLLGCFSHTPVPVPITSPPPTGLLFVVSGGGHVWATFEGPAPELAEPGELIQGPEGDLALVRPLSTDRVPAELAGLTSVRLASGCVARVTSFVRLDRLFGDPTYAGEEVTSWTPELVVRHGAAVVAAELEGCAVERWGRAAELAAPVVWNTEDATMEQEQAARSALLASVASGALEGVPTVDVRLLRHPGTGVVRVMAHAHLDGSCGEPTGSVLGLYEVDPNGGLRAVVERDLGDVLTVDEILDVEGDGELELIGRTWLEQQLVLESVSGGRRGGLSTPFYQCPC
ncbi:MAG: hypothetical protein H6735_00855 [Alphaproteobacteria bacterium]|nr:hypothetical protein [Alphaproteobacteria bacterium]